MLGRLAREINFPPDTEELINAGMITGTLQRRTGEKGRTGVGGK